MEYYYNRKRRDSVSYLPRAESCQGSFYRSEGTHHYPLHAVVPRRAFITLVAQSPVA